MVLFEFFQQLFYVFYKVEIINEFVDMSNYSDTETSNTAKNSTSLEPTLNGTAPIGGVDANSVS
jgi:hypothetical protein